MENLTINNLGSYICYCEAQGLSNIFKAYAENANREEIMQIGFNPNSGYTFIALENGVKICSMLGRDVEYLGIYDEDAEDEAIFDTYEEAINSINN